MMNTNTGKLDMTNFDYNNILAQFTFTTLEVYNMTKRNSRGSSHIITFSLL